MIDQLEASPDAVDVGLPTKARRYKRTDFLLGALGGGVRGGGVGFLLFSADRDGSLNKKKAKKAVPIAAGSGVLLGGLLGLVLGATSENPAAAPRVGLPGPENAPIYVSALPQGFRLDWQF